MLYPGSRIPHILAIETKFILARSTLSWIMSFLLALGIYLILASNMLNPVKKYLLSWIEIHFILALAIHFILDRNKLYPG